MTIHNPEATNTVRYFDADVEAALLGHVLADPSALAEAVAHCTADDFAWEPHARIFEAAQAICEEGFAVQPVAVKPRLAGEVLRDLEAKSGLPALTYLETIASRATPFQRVKDLARIVADLALRRRVDAELEAGRIRISDKSAPVTLALAGVVDVVSEVLDRTARAKGHRSIGDIADAVLAKTEAAMNGTLPPAIRTGVRELDDLTGGAQAGDVWIIAGRPGMGKTVKLASVALRAALAGQPVVFFSLEMPAGQLAERMACDVDYDGRAFDQSPLRYESFRRGKVTEAEFQRLYAALRTLRSLPLEIIDTGGLTIAEISAVASRFAARHSGSIGAVIIDYLQLVAPSDRYRGRKVDELGEITGAAKGLAKRIGWPVIVGCQLSRAVESREIKRPVLSDLRDSGMIEQDADVVAGLYREGYYAGEKRPPRGPADPAYASWAAEYRLVANDLEISLLKNRHGRPGSVMAYVDVGASVIRNRPGSNLSVVADNEIPERRSA